MLQGVSALGQPVDVGASITSAVTTEPVNMPQTSSAKLTAGPHDTGHSSEGEFILSVCPGGRSRATTPTNPGDHLVRLRRPNRLLIAPIIQVWLLFRSSPLSTLLVIYR